MRIDDERTIAADDAEKADDRGLGSLRSLLFSSRFKVPAIFASSARHFHPKLSTDARGYSQITVRELTQINTNYSMLCRGEPVWKARLQTPYILCLFFEPIKSLETNLLCIFQDKRQLKRRETVSETLYQRSRHKMQKILMVQLRIL